MQMEFAIIESLTEPRNRSRMLETTRKILKEVGKKCNNEKFIASLKILKKEKMIVTKKGEGRQVIYSRSSEPQAIRDIELLRMHVEETEKLEYIENQIKNFEKNIKWLQTNDYPDKVNHIKKILEHATNIELSLLGRAKLCLMLKNGPWMISFLKKEIECHQEQCEKLYKRLGRNLEILDFPSAFKIFSKQYKETQREINRHSKRAVESEQYFRKFLSP